MRTYDLQRLLDAPGLVEERLRELTEKKLLFTQEVDKEEVAGHMRKAEHNLRFVADILDKDYVDWVLTGCYYACYHAALALIQTKGYTSKNHLATLCVLIKEFYDNGLTKEDIEALSDLLDYKDLLFYVETKNKREEAAYSTRTLFDRKEAGRLRLQATLFVNKIRDLIDG